MQKTQANVSGVFTLVLAALPIFALFLSNASFTLTA